MGIAVCLSVAILGWPLGRPTESTKESIRAAVTGIYAAINAGDPAGVLEYMATGGYTEITESGDRITIDELHIRRVLGPTVRGNLAATDLEIRIFGDVSVVTGYRVGGLQAQGLLLPSARLALSMLWVRQHGGWKLAHVHLSPTFNKP